MLIIKEDSKTKTEWVVSAYLDGQEAIDNAILRVSDAIRSIQPVHHDVDHALHQATVTGHQKDAIGA